MEDIVFYIHTIIALIPTIAVFLIIDLPLKILANLIIIVVEIVNSIFYPITKNITGPRWMDKFFRYATTMKYTFAEKVLNSWSDK